MLVVALSLVDSACVYICVKEKKDHVGSENHSHFDQNALIPRTVQLLYQQTKQAQPERSDRVLERRKEAEGVT